MDNLLDDNLIRENHGNNNNIQLRPIKERAGQAKIWLVISVALSSLATILTLVSTQVTYSSWVFSALEFTDRIQGFLGIAVGVIFIRWFRRSYYNAHLLTNSQGLQYTEGWAAGAWFLPIANFFIPYQIAQSMHKVFIEKTETFANDRIKNNIALWWFFWIMPIVLSLIIVIYSIGALGGGYKPIEENYTTFFIAVLVLSLIGQIAAAYYAIQMINSFSKIQEELNSQSPNYYTD